MSPSSMAARFPALLRGARERAGLTQRQLADAAGIPQPRISDYERGYRTPSLGRAERLLALVGMELTTSSATLDRTDRELLDLARGLTPRQRLDQAVALARLRGRPASGRDGDP